MTSCWHPGTEPVSESHVTRLRLLTVGLVLLCGAAMLWLAGNGGAALTGKELAGLLLFFLWP